MNDRYYRTIRIKGDAKSIAARPSVNRFRMGRHSQAAFRQSGFRTGTMADGKNTVFARNHGLPIVQLFHSTRGFYERRADRRYGMRQQLDWIRHPSHTGADAGNSAHGRNGHAIDYTYFSDGFYKSDERAAKSAQKGLWQGTFTEPYQWRKQNKR